MSNERRNSSRAFSLSLPAKFQSAKAAIHKTCASFGARSAARQARRTASARSASLRAIQPWKWHCPRTGRYEHRLIKGGVGHNLPQEAPRDFAQAVVDVSRA